MPALSPPPNTAATSPERQREGDKTSSERQRGVLCDGGAPIVDAAGTWPSAAAEAADVLRARFRQAIDAAGPTPPQRKWRLGVFERGLKLAAEIEARLGPLTGRRVLDVGAAFGGDVAALVARGATCVAADKFDHDYDRLLAHLDAGERLSYTLFDCTRPWPVPDHSFDVVISMSVLEIIDDLDFWFGELLRVLKPDGLAIVDTGSALRMARCDPLFKLPLISLLPTPLRCGIAAHVFGRRYRFHISRHTFYTAGKFRRYVAPRGFAAVPCKYADSPLMRRLSAWPLGRGWQWLVRRFAWDFVVIRRA